MYHELSRLPLACAEMCVCGWKIQVDVGKLFSFQAERVGLKISQVIEMDE